MSLSNKSNAIHDDTKIKLLSASKDDSNLWKNNRKFDVDDPTFKTYGASDIFEDSTNKIAIENTIEDFKADNQYRTGSGGSMYSMMTDELRTNRIITVN